MNEDEDGYDAEHIEEAVNCDPDEGEKIWFDNFKSKIYSILYSGYKFERGNYVIDKTDKKKITDILHHLDVIYKDHINDLNTNYTMNKK
jgi:hypothetical protein